MVTILLFPGQGTQKVGMGKDLAEAFPEARDTFSSIDAALGFPLSRTMWEGPDSELQQTHVTQPAVLAHSAAVLAVAGRKIGSVAGAAGHSLGEYTAWVASGALTPVDGAGLVRRRGQLMQAAGTRRPGAMSAVLGLATAQVEQACLKASTHGETAVAANLNAPDQTVISGDPAAVERAGEGCKAAGARRVMALKVSGAFHSPLMAPALPGLTAALAEAPFGAAAFPVVANATAAPASSPDQARHLLALQLTSPVRWVECMQTLAQLAPDARFIEVGPGAVLGGLLKRILPSPEYLSLGTAAEVEKFIA